MASVLSLLGMALHAAPGASSSSPRYPSDLCLDLSGRWIYTANEESGSVSVLSLESGEVVDEAALDPAGRPSAIAISRTYEGRTISGGRVLAVAERFQHRVAIVVVGYSGDSAAPRLRVARKLEVGRLPADLCFIRTGNLLVASEGASEVWELEPERWSLVRRIPAIEGVRRLALDANGATSGSALLAVTGRTEAAQIDLASGDLLWKKRPAQSKAFNLDGLAMVDGRVFAAHQIRPTEAAIDPQMIVWGLIIANRLSILPPLDPGYGPATAQPHESDADAQVVSLDDRHRAAGDPTAVEMLPARTGRNEAPIALVASGGTDRLLIVDTGAEPHAYGARYGRHETLRSVRVGDRPVAIALDGEARTAYVACYLDDSVVEVDIAGGKVTRTLRLGPADHGERHAGARIFFDADRSRGGWYSCHSCHPDGGTRGHVFDTPSDGEGLAKKSPDLRGTTLTGPWSWLGGFEVLQQQVAASLEKTMAVDHPPVAAEVEQVIAFLQSLGHPRSAASPEEPGGDAARGEELFERGDCGRCHQPPAYTIKATRDVGVTDPYPDARKLYNPPSLIGVRDRYRYLHDGRAASLREVFREHNPEGKHGEAREFSDAELRDLIAFLRTL